VQKVPTVLDGGRVAGSVHDGGTASGRRHKAIKAGKLRGVESLRHDLFGIEELGSSDRNAYPEAPEGGIYVFPEGYRKARRGCRGSARASA
jgi:phenylalanyl-tRNA synthetase beta chain